MMAVFLPLWASTQEPPKPGPLIDETLVPYASTADSVKLPDGRDLHFVCMGKGAPTVILTAGLGDFAGAAWSTVQPAMAMTTRVCAWDRPGFGLSDGSSGKQTVATTTADLEAALATDKIRAPYVMVGHSAGAFETLLFADRHRDRVVGMVLVDPSLPDQFALIDRVAPALAGPDPEQNPMVKIFRKCAEDMRTGRARPGGPDADGCWRIPPNFPPAFNKALAAKIGPVQYEAMASFMTSMAEDATIAINPSRNYGNMPLIVLTATERGLPPNASAEEKSQSPAFDAAVNQAHDKLAALSARGINARVPGANHYIQRSRPQVVIDAVATVVREARQGPSAFKSRRASKKIVR
jgi:pimeloyl-ACP methyl ester carboxylesterase